MKNLLLPLFACIGSISFAQQSDYPIQSVNFTAVN